MCFNTKKYGSIFVTETKRVVPTSVDMTLNFLSMTIMS